MVLTIKSIILLFAVFCGLNVVFNLLMQAISTRIKQRELKKQLETVYIFLGEKIKKGVEKKNDL